MSEQQFHVTFQPSGCSVFVLSGTKIIEAAGRAGLAINTPCGGEGSCRKCRVQITVTQIDIRELQLAVGAIRAGINIMLRKTSTKTEDIKHIFIAGGFGSFIRRTNAQRTGLLPSKIDHQKITYVGNTSLSGAKWALLSTNVRKNVEEIAEKTSHIQLSLDSQFQAEFVDAMIFP